MSATIKNVETSTKQTILNCGLVPIHIVAGDDFCFRKHEDEMEEIRASVDIRLTNEDCFNQEQINTLIYQFDLDYFKVVLNYIDSREVHAILLMKNNASTTLDEVYIDSTSFFSEECLIKQPGDIVQWISDKIQNAVSNMTDQNEIC